MSELKYNTDVMKEVIRESKRIITLKRALELLSTTEYLLKRAQSPHIFKVTTAQSEIQISIRMIEIYIAGKMAKVVGNIPFFPEITHFTQKELDAGYAVVEHSLSDGPEYFDKDGDFVEVFVKHAIILHNGKVIPFSHANSQVIINQAKPV
jgi:hypothetical protein